MPTTVMNHQIYDNYFLSNEIEDQFNSRLDLSKFCKVDHSLEGVAGMEVEIHTYRATDGTQKLKIGEGNTKDIEVSYTDEKYVIELAQNRFRWNDEQEMKDPNLVPTGTKHLSTDMFNTVNGDVFGEFNKTQLKVETPAYDFDAFVDAQSMFDVENIEDINMFAFVHPKDVGELRKNLKEDLKYITDFISKGYIGTVAGINIYTKRDAKQGEIVVGTNDAVTIFAKTGTEVEQFNKGNRSEEEANIRRNTIYSRKYYLVALTDERQAIKLVKKGAKPKAK